MDQTPYEAWSRRKPSVSHLRIFGCVAYALIDSQNHRKIDEKSIKCNFVGYCSNSKAYKLYNPTNGKVIISKNVVFDEEVGWIWHRIEEGIQFNTSTEDKAPTTIAQQ